MKIVKIIALLIIFGFIGALILGFLLDIDFQKNLIKTNDISLYEEKEYPYLPRYSDFKYKEYVTGFYTYDSSYTLCGGSVSFVLQLQFTEKEDYTEFLEYELKRYEYGSSPIVLKNDYECYLCLDEEVTRYNYHDKRPYSLGMLCLDEENLLTRYVFYINMEYSVDKKFNDVFDNTNCDW